jgi:hypothetical protein
MATIDVRHHGLGRFERVFAPTRASAERRADALAAEWQAAFLSHGAPSKAEIAARNGAAERALAALTAILIGAVRPSFEDAFRPDTSAFSEPHPVAPPPPLHDPEPQATDYPRSKLTLATLVTPGALRRRRETAEAKYATAHDAWRTLRDWRQREYDKVLAAYRAAEADWLAREAAFRTRQAGANAHLAALVDGACRHEPQAVAALCDVQLLALDRPQGFPCFWVLGFADGVVTIDYDLPNIDVVPLVKAVKPSPSGFDLVVLSEAERERIYGEAVLQTTLAVIHTLFAGDAAGAIRAVAFSGWANYVDRTALRPGRASIVSLTADKERFQSYDLKAVDPQACVRALNGTLGTKLAAMLG